MYLQTLQLTNFKNYESLNLELSPGLNGFVGNNGCGKTNILDAVYYLSMCKSYLNSNDRQNIRFDQSFFSISGNWNISQKAGMNFLGEGINTKNTICLGLCFVILLIQAFWK